jgi:thiamine kinase-like enzyme
LRLRHLLLSNENIPYLIDWEFSNISEPSQDLAKLIFDWVVNHWLDFKLFFHKVIDRYSHENNISFELLRKRVLTFLPIIPLEHTTSFILRKPEWYKQEVLKDLSFINKVFNEEN